MILYLDSQQTIGRASRQAVKQSRQCVAVVTQGAAGLKVMRAHQWVGMGWFGDSGKSAKAQGVYPVVLCPRACDGGGLVGEAPACGDAT